MTRREQIADAAIATLAATGMRGLTHRAVDRAAGLPEGSCSYYFRTRLALLQATVERLVEADTADLPAEPLDIARDAAAIIGHWTTVGRARMLARYELMLEAGRRPEMRAVFARARDHYHRLAEATLTAAGAADPAGQAQLFIACLDGLVFRHLTGADPITASPAALTVAFEDLLRGFRPR